MKKDKKEDNGKQMKQYGDKISAWSEKATWRSEQKKKKHGRPKSNEQDGGEKPLEGTGG